MPPPTEVVLPEGYGTFAGTVDAYAHQVEAPASTRRPPAALRVVGRLTVVVCVCVCVSFAAVLAARDSSRITSSATAINLLASNASGS